MAINIEIYILLDREIVLIDQRIAFNWQKL